MDANTPLWVEESTRSAIILEEIVNIFFTPHTHKDGDKVWVAEAGEGGGWWYMWANGDMHHSYKSPEWMEYEEVRG